MAGRSPPTECEEPSRGVRRHSKEPQRPSPPGLVAARRRHGGPTDLRHPQAARDFKNDLLARVAADSWIDPRRGRITFNEWADRWWQLWSSAPRRSPKGKETTASHLRCHLRPYFGRRQLRQLTPSIVLRWQNELEGRSTS